MRGVKHTFTFLFSNLQPPEEANTPHMLQKTANFGYKDRRSRPDRADFWLGSVNSTVPE